MVILLIMNDFFERQSVKDVKPRGLRLNEER